MKTTKHIDAVITWVDGSDKIHQKKMASYLSNYKVKPSSADSTRFSDNGEINFCIRSILKFSPWIRNIYIVTDEQTPLFYEQLSYPDLINRIQIIDHKEIFKGFEQHLPVFNSLSIEAMLWRIKGLSEDFIYFNDDMMLIRPLHTTDFISSSGYTLRGRWRKKRNQKFLHKLRLKFKKVDVNTVHHRDTQESSSDAIDDTSLYLDLPHNPVILNRSFFKEFFEKNPSFLEQTISHRFRHSEQLWAVSLFTHYALSQNIGNIDNRIKTVYLKADKYPEPRIAKVFNAAEKDDRYRFGCVQSLDSATDSTQKFIKEWLKQRISA